MNEDHQLKKYLSGVPPKIKKCLLVLFGGSVVPVWRRHIADSGEEEPRRWREWKTRIRSSELCRFYGTILGTDVWTKPMALVGLVLGNKTRGLNGWYKNAWTELGYEKYIQSHNIPDKSHQRELLLESLLAAAEKRTRKRRNRSKKKIIWSLGLLFWTLFKRLTGQRKIEMNPASKSSKSQS